MRISYAITVCDEIHEIQNLIRLLIDNIRTNDEIVVLYDNNGTKEVFDYLQSVEGIKLVVDNFDGRFDEWKNKLTSLCGGDYIFQIDADEIPSISLIKKLPSIFEKNQKTDLFFVPRINFVDGITDDDMAMWNWKIEDNKINWPDYQSRIYRNEENIKWVNKVHETIKGHKYFTFLPKEIEYTLLHVKTISKQRKQNEFYSKLL